MAPVMMRVAWFCTLLTRSKLDLAVVPHAVIPYSSTGLTLPVYSRLRVTVSAPHVDFYIKLQDFLKVTSVYLPYRIIQSKPGHFTEIWP